MRFYVSLLFLYIFFFFFFSSRRRHTRFDCDWSSDVCSSDLVPAGQGERFYEAVMSALVQRRGLDPPLGEAHRVRPIARALCLDHQPLARSEEHTSELQSQSNLVCRLLLEKKKNLHSPVFHRRHNRLHVETS